MLGLVVASALAIVACGGNNDEKSAYVEDLNAVTSTLNAGTSELARAPSIGTSPSEVAGTYADLAVEVDGAAAQLEDITPPEDVAELHDRLVAQLEDFGAAANDASDEISAGGAAAIPAAAAELIDVANRLSAEVGSTMDEINSTLQG